MGVSIRWLAGGPAEPGEHVGWRDRHPRFYSLIGRGACGTTKRNRVVARVKRFLFADWPGGLRNWKLNPDDKSELVSIR